MMIVEMRLEALALDEFHGDVVEAVFFAGVVNHDDVGVGQKAGSAGFGLEALQKLGARKTGAFFTEADGLNGYGAANHRVFRFVHHAHGAAAEFADDFIPPGFGQSGHQRIRRRRGFRLSFLSVPQQRFEWPDRLNPGRAHFHPSLAPYPLNF